MTTRDDGGLLIDGETVVWSGKPAQGLLFTSRDWLLIPFSLLWCGFTIFWEATALSLAAAPLFMKLFGAAFVLIGLYFVAGRFLLDAWVRNGTQYAITNKRVLIARSWPFAKFTALSLNRLPETSLVERAKGRGTIFFGQAISNSWRGNSFSSWTPSLDPTPAFIGIEDARSVSTRATLSARDDETVRKGATILRSFAPPSGTSATSMSGSTPSASGWPDR